jgi:preprotein translocase subunit SecD
MSAGVRILLSIPLVFLILVSLAVLAYSFVQLNSLKSGQGTRLTMSLKINTTTTEPRGIDHATWILRNRLNNLGISSAEVEPRNQDGYSIEVFLPPVDDLDRVKHILCADAGLELRLVAHGTIVPYRDRDAAAAALASLANAPSFELLVYRESASRAADAGDSWIIVEKNPVITGADLRDASAKRSSYGVENYDIAFSLTPEAASRFAGFTGSHIGEHLAIVIQSKVRSAPTLQAQISDRGMISGDFSKRSAEDLALVLRSGAYPGELVLVGEDTVSTERWTRVYKVMAAASAAFLILIALGLYVVNRRRTEMNQE